MNTWKPQETSGGEMVNDSRMLVLFFRNFLKLMKRGEFRELVAKHGDAFLTET